MLAFDTSANEQVLCCDVVELLESIRAKSVHMVVLHPPDNFGVVNGDNESTLEEMITALQPIAEQVNRVLVNGGASVMVSNPLLMSAWEIAITWAGLRLANELVVLWDVHRKRFECGACSLASIIRWHVNPGLRRSSNIALNMNSNVIVCSRVDPLNRYSPSQLPVELGNYLVSLLTHEGDLVVDPMCGTGTFLVASELCNRQWLGGDIDSGQCRIAVERTGYVDDQELNPLYLWSRGRLVPIEG